MIQCHCPVQHEHRSVVLTGGPGAGKTAVLELVRQNFCKHVHVMPESASILFNGGFPRGPSTEERKSIQRAIYFVQRELEASFQAANGGAMYLCDRGTIDGFAYWPGPEDYWQALGTTQSAEMSRYHAVIHLRTPSIEQGYNHSNPARTESAMEAARVDERLVAAWDGHPRRYFVNSTDNFFEKARIALGLIMEEMPECCRHAIRG